MEKLKKYVLSTRFLFIAVLALSAVVFLLMLFPDTGSLLGPNIFIFWILLAFSGMGLAIITYKERISGKLKFFLFSSGFSSGGFLLGVVLHNAFYALGTLTEDLTILHAFLNFLEGTFFLIAVIACPIGLLVGVVGTLILWMKDGKRA